MDQGRPTDRGNDLTFLLFWQTKFSSHWRVACAILSTPKAAPHKCARHPKSQIRLHYGQTFLFFPHHGPEHPNLDCIQSEGVRVSMPKHIHRAPPHTGLNGSHASGVLQHTGTKTFMHFRGIGITELTQIPRKRHSPPQIKQTSIGIIDGIREPGARRSDITR